MPIFEREMDLEKMKQVKATCVCAECNSGLDIAWGGFWGWNEYVLRCTKDIEHARIARLYEPSPYAIPGFNLFNLNRGRRRMTQNIVGDKGTALAKYQGVLALKKAEALEILQTVFPDAPVKEMTRAVLLCTSYHLNPLMGHVFLIPFNKGKPNETWATVIGIKAKRLLASRRQPYMYLDDTPRLMNEAEQIKVFGKVDADHIVAITKLRNPQTGAEGRGYGKWRKDATVYGTDKGNSAENMAFIRSESQATDRLAPGEMPVGFDVVDEQFLEANVVEGEFKEVADGTSLGKIDGKPVRYGYDSAGNKIGRERKATKSTKEEPPDPDRLPEDPVPNTVEALKEWMAKCNWSATDAGAFFNKEKSWNIKDYKDLTPEQISEAIQFIKENPK